MDFKEVDHHLEELEGRIERLKALYEQYFMGIEKLEPLVPRKDVDRRIVILRREQVRNTAQRFKFQTLVQRYNSFQQYWARVGREIETGTYHRDVARAAARFGAKDALTIFGKKQAEKYQRLVANQEARRARRTTTHTIDDELIADDELMFVDDESEANDARDADDESRPTPVIPPAKRASGPPSPPAIPPAPPPPRASTPGMPAVPPRLPPGARVSGQISVPVVNVKPDIADEFDLQDEEILEFIPDKPARARKAIAETMFPMMMRRPSEQLPKVVESPAPEPAQRSPSIPPDPEAGKKRAAALAAQVKQRTTTSTAPQANRPLDLELDLGQAPPPSKTSRVLDLDFDREPKSQDKPPAKKVERGLELDLDQGSQTRERPAAKAVRALELDLEQGVRAREEPAAKAERQASVPAARAENEGLTGRTERTEVRAAVTLAEKKADAKEERPVESTRAPLSGEDPRAAGARVAAAARERAANAREASGGAGGLSESRMRQIYGEYVDAKRAVKESTAGVTFDTLAKQLKQQAEKLEASHPGRKVDYSVVMKNGKPTLKPILR